MIFKRRRGRLVKSEAEIAASSPSEFGQKNVFKCLVQGVQKAVPDFSNVGHMKQPFLGDFVPSVAAGDFFVIVKLFK